MAFRDWLIHTCDIEEATIARNDIGEEVATWSTKAGDEPCRYVVDRERRGNEQESAQFVTVTKLFLRALASADATNRITNITLEDGTVLPGPFGIEQVLPRRAKRLRHTTLILEEVS